MARRRPKAPRRFWFESLEDRRLLAGDVKVALSGGNLIVTGDNLSNGITVTGTAVTGVDANGTGATTINGASTPFAISGAISNVVIDMGDGADSVDVSALTASGTMHINLGKGDDTLAIKTTSVARSFVVTGGDGNDSFNYGAGNSLAGQHPTPPNPSVTGDATIAEGATYTLHLSSSGGNSPITGWTIDWGDNSTDGTAAASDTTATHVYADNGSFTISAKAATANGTFEDTLAVTVTDVAPTVTITDNDTANQVKEGTPHSWKLGNVVDPAGANDTVTNYIIHWGDSSSPETISAATLATANRVITHTYVDGPTTPTIVVDIVDEDGTHTNAGSLQVTVTNANPVATIGVPAGPFTEGSAVNLTGSFTDAGTNDDPHTFLWHVVASNGQTITDGTSQNFSFTPNDNGSYTVTFKVTDKDGGNNTDTEVITVGNANPVATIGVPAGPFTEGSAVNLTGSFTDAGTNDDPHTFLWHVVASNGQTITDGTSQNFSFTPNDNGSYTVTFKVTDKDGGNNTDTEVITVGNANPVATIGVPAGPFTEGSAVNLTGSFTDAGTNDDPHTFLWHVVASNGQTITDGTSQNFSFTPNDNGSYTVTFKVTDKDGGNNTDTEVITVGNANPVATIGVPAGPFTEGSAVNLTGSFTDAGTNDDPHTFLWHVVASNGQTITDGTSQNFSFTPNDNGSYTVTFKVTDKDGGNNTDTEVITVGNVAPALSNLELTTATIDEGGAAKLTTFITDPGINDEFSVDVNWGDGPSETITGLGQSNITATPYVVSDTVNGNLESLGDTDRFSFNANGGDTYTFDTALGTLHDSVLSLLDTDGTTELTNNDDVPGRPDRSSHIDWTAPASGTYFIVVSAYHDGFFGTYSLSSTGRSIAGTPIEQTSSALATGGTAFAETPSGKTEYAWDTATRQLTLRHWYLDDPDGTPDDYTVTVTAHDGDGGTSTPPKTATVTVNNVVPSPTIDGAPEDSVPEGTPIDLSSTPNDPGSLDTFTYEWSVTKDGAAYAVTNTSDATFSFTPDDNGSYVVTLKVADDDMTGNFATGTDGTDFVATTATITVDNVNPAPTIGVPAGPFTEGRPVNLTGSFTDAGTNDDPHTFLWHVVASNGQTITDGTSQNFSFTPNDNGSYTVTFKVTDKDGGNNTDTKTITVDNVAPALSDLNPATQTIDEGGAVLLTTIITDPGIDDVFSVDVDWGDGTSETISSLGLSNITATPYVVTDTVNGKLEAAGDKDRFSFIANSGDAYTFDTTLGTLDDTILSLLDTDGTTELAHNDDAVPGVNYASHISWTAPASGTYFIVVSGFSANFGTYSLSSTGSSTAATPVEQTSSALATGGTAFAETPSGKTGYAWDAATRQLTLGHWYFDDPAGTPDDYHVTVTGHDGDGGTSTPPKTATVTVNNVKPAPTIDGAPTASIAEGTAVSLTANPHDPGSADTFTYLWHVVASNGQTIADASTPTFNFTPNDDGTYTVTLRVADDDMTGNFATGTDGTDFVETPATVITVDNANPVPTIGVPAGPFTEGSAVNLTGSFTDAGTNDDPHTFLWHVVASNGQTITDGTSQNFSFTPNDNGSYTVTFKVTDKDGGNNTDTEVITVGNVAPTADFTNDGPVDEGSSHPTLSFTNQFDPSPTDTTAGFHYAYDLSNDGTFEAGDGTYAGSGTNATENIGLSVTDGPSTYSVRGRIIDIDGSFTDYLTAIQINNVNPQLTAPTPATQTIDEGGTATLTTTLSDDGAHDLLSVQVAWGDGKNYTIPNLSQTSPLSGSESNSGYNFTYNWTASSKTLVVTHNYLQSTGASGVTVTLTPSDDDGGIGTDQTTTVHVNNVAATVDLTGTTPAPTQNTPFTLTGNSFTDPGLKNEHTLIMTWGDGSTSTFTLPATNTLVADPPIDQSSGAAASFKPTNIDVTTGKVDFEVTYTYTGTQNNIHIDASITDGVQATAGTDSTSTFSIA